MAQVPVMVHRQILKGMHQGWVLRAIISQKDVDFLLEVLHYIDASGKVMSSTFHHWIVVSFTTCWGFTSMSHLEGKLQSGTQSLQILDASHRVFYIL